MYHSYIRLPFKKVKKALRIYVLLEYNLSDTYLFIILTQVVVVYFFFKNILIEGPLIPFQAMAVLILCQKLSYSNISTISYIIYHISYIIYHNSPYHQSLIPLQKLLCENYCHKIYLILVIYISFAKKTDVELNSTAFLFQLPKKM